jgi:hypothetical protein
MSNRSSETVRVGTQAVHPSDIRDLWDESLRIIQLPVPGAHMTSKDSEIGVSYHTDAGTSKTTRFDDAEDLLRSAQIPDEVDHLTFRHYLQFRSDSTKGDTTSRTLEFSTGGEYSGSTLEFSGEPDWVAGAVTSLSPILKRHPREVGLKRLGITWGFTLPLAAVFGFLVYQFAVWGNYLGTLLSFFGVFAAFFAGPMYLSDRAEEWLPKVRVAVRGEPHDPKFLANIWEFVTGTLLVVVIGILLGYFGIPH